MADEDVVEVITDGPNTVVVTPVNINPEYIEINNGQMGPRGPQGLQGERGPAGAGAENIAYEYVQAMPTTDWLITHPLDFKPSVTVADSAGTEQIGSVTYTGPHTLIISFGKPFSGSAYLS